MNPYQLAEEISPVSEHENLNKDSGSERRPSVANQESLSFVDKKRRAVLIIPI